MSEFKEIQFRLQPELRFQDGTIPDIEPRLWEPSRATRARSRPSLGSAVDRSRPCGSDDQRAGPGQRSEAMRLPEVNQAFLDSISFESLAELREAVRESLERRIKTEQRQAIRRQILDQLLSRTPFELPAELVSREEKSTISRLVAQLKQEGMSDNEIRASEAQIRANAHETTLRTLKEFLLLSKIADAEGIKVEEEDLALEIEAIAARTDESVRRVRARVEKEGGADSLATQILERKVIDRILEDVRDRRRRRSRSSPRARSRPWTSRPPPPRTSATAEATTRTRKTLEKDREPSTRPDAGSTGLA